MTLQDSVNSIGIVLDATCSDPATWGLPLDCRAWPTRTGAMMTRAVVVGMFGFAFHLSGGLGGTGQFSFERILVFAPIPAPLLYSDLGMLGLIVVPNENM